MDELSTFGGRLKWAIKRYGPRPETRPGAEGSVNQFHQLLSGKVKAGAGAGYQTLWRIIADRAEPSEDFVRAALELLPGVRRDWLVDGDGPPTEAHTRAETAAEAEVPETYDRLVKAVPELETLSPVVAGALAMCVFRLEDALGRARVPVDAEDYEEMAVLVWRLVQAPFTAWASVLGRVPETNTWDFSEYAMGMLHAVLGSLRIAFPERLSRKDMEKWQPYDPDQED